jgi:archaellin
LKHLALFLISVSVAFTATGCLKKSEKQKPYYYSEEEVDSHKENTQTVVDISDPVVVRKFLAGKKYVCKTYRIEISDSLDAVIKNNGKVLSKGTLEVGEFMVNDERLVLIKDEAGETFRFTLAHNGMLTDKETYALYKPE